MFEATDILDGATGESASMDNVSRLRMSAAYLLMTDIDAQFAIIRQLVKYIDRDYNRVVSLLADLKNTLCTRSTVGETLDFTRDKEDLSRLVTGTTQIGRAVTTRVLANIDAAGLKLNGVSLEELISSVDGIRAQVDPLVARLAENVWWLGRARKVDLTIAEKYYTSSRAKVAASALEQAEKAAAGGRLVAAMEQLAVARVGLTPVSLATSDSRGTISVHPLASAAWVDVSGTSSVLPLHLTTPTDLVVNVNTTPPRVMTLPLPLSTPPVAQTVPLPSAGFTVTPAKELRLQAYADGPVYTASIGGTFTPAQMADQLVISFPDVFAAATTVATSPTEEFISLTGHPGLGIIVYPLLPSPLDTDHLHITLRQDGRDVALADLEDAWATIPNAPVITESAGAISLRFEGCLSVTCSGEGAAALSLPSVSAGWTTQIQTTGILRTGDLVVPGGSAVRQLGRGTWLLQDPIPANTATMTVSSAAAPLYSTIATSVTTPQMMRNIALWKNGLPQSFWSVVYTEVRAADRTRALQEVDNVLVELAPLATLLSSYRVVESPEVTALFDRMDGYGLDMAAWYLATFRLNAFFTAPADELSSAGVNARMEKDLAERLKAYRR